MSGIERAMRIIEEVENNKFKFEVNPSASSLLIEINGARERGAPCSRLQSKN